MKCQSGALQLHSTRKVHTDEPHEGPLDGVDGLVQVVAVEAQPGLQAQRVSGAQARGLHLLEAQQRAVHMQW
jgi:hypothetical protein